MAHHAEPRCTESVLRSLLAKISSLAVGGIVLTAGVLWGCSPRDSTVAIERVTVINGDGMATGNQTVLLRDSTILSVGPASDVDVPQGANRINGEGRYLMPGLMDLHVHLSKARSPALPVLVAYGVTTVRDMGGDWDELREWRRQIRSGERVGPRIFSSGPYLEAPANVERMTSLREGSGTVEPVERTRVPIGSAERVYHVVDSLAATGVDWIKFRTLPSMAVFQALVAATDSVGLPMAGHPYGLPLYLLAEGTVESLEHMVFPVYDDTAEADRRSAWRRMARHDVIMVPTLVQWEQSTLAPDGLLEAIVADTAGKRYEDQRYTARYLLLDWREQLAERQESGEDAGGIDWEAIYASTLRNVREMHDEGISVLPGSDLAVVGVFPGRSLHQELALMVERLGITPGEVLAAATGQSAQALGIDADVGWIAEGMKADLVLLEANPLIDIHNTSQIHTVFRNGEMFDPEGRKQLLETAAKAPARSHNDWHPR